MYFEYVVAAGIRRNAFVCDGGYFDLRITPKAPCTPIAYGISVFLSYFFGGETRASR